MQTEERRERKRLFQEHCKSSLFFSGGGRGAVFDDLKGAFQDDVDLVTLIGEEGSGKTMLCKMVLEQWDTSCRRVFISHVVESFEDVVRITARECNVAFPAEANRADARKIFLELMALLRKEGESLLLICDEAEKMYLATLERIRKILDDVNREGGGLQVLFSGRASLRNNLEQLALCNFAQISEKQLFLSPLDEDDTWKYLNFCMQVQEGNGQKEVFVREAAEKIASIARGNLRMINILANEALQFSNADGPFLVLLDHVKDSCSIEETIPAMQGILQRLPFPPKYLIPGGAVLFLLLLIFLFRGNSEQEVVEKRGPSGESIVASSQVEEREETGLEEVSGGGRPEKPPLITPAGSVQSAVTMVIPAEKEEATPQPDTERVVEEEVLLPVAVEREEPDPITVKPEGAVEQEAVEPEKQVERELEPGLRAPRYTPVAISPVEIVESSTADQTVPELLANGKILPEGGTKRIVVEQEKQLPEKKKKVFIRENRKKIDPVLANLVAAGEEWQAGAMDDQFTIQLMALTSNQAEDNLKQIVTREEYSEVVDKLVVLRRPSDPPVVLVFYGLYPSMAAARNARNNMPIALRKHHPYAISVRGAVEKSSFE